MTLANMREQGVHHLIAFCLNDAWRHQALIDVSSYPSDTPVPWFRSKVKCAKCGARGHRIDVRPNWKEAPGMPDSWEGRPALGNVTPDGTVAHQQAGNADGGAAMMSIRSGPVRLLANRLARLDVRPVPIPRSS